MRFERHLLEFKGPVMDRLRKSDALNALNHLSGQVFDARFQAAQSLAPELLGQEISSGDHA